MFELSQQPIGDLDRLIQQGLFREDLYFRLNVVPLRVCHLCRERTEDIPDLVRHFLTVCESRGIAGKRFLDTECPGTPQRPIAGRAMCVSLKTLVRRLSAIQADERITEEAVTQALSSDSHSPLRKHLWQGAANTTLGEFTESYLAEYFSQYGSETPPTFRTLR